MSKTTALGTQRQNWEGHKSSSAWVSKKIQTRMDSVELSQKKNKEEAGM